MNKKQLKKISSIPIPKINKDSTFKSDEEKLLELNKLLNVPVPKSGFKEENRFLNYYSFPIFLIVSSIAGLLMLIFNREGLGLFHFMFLSLYIGICLPIVSGLGIYMLFRIITYDKNYLTGEIVKRTSNNFIIANFFLTQKRIKKVVCKIDKDGISFIIGDCVYIIDREECWIDENNYINGFWLPNLPNQLRFDFGKQIEIALKKLSKIKDGEQVDLGDTDIFYSSQNLKKYKDDKFLAEMHEQFTPEAMKMLYIAFGIIGLAIIGFVIMFAIQK